MFRISFSHRINPRIDLSHLKSSQAPKTRPRSQNRCTRPTWPTREVDTQVDPQVDSRVDLVGGEVDPSVDPPVDLSGRDFSRLP